MGLGVLFAGLSGAGKSVAEDIETRQKYDHEAAMLKERADLEEQKQLAIDMAKRNRDAADRTKQGKDISEGVTALQNERDAAAINAKEGSNMTAEDAAVLRNNPEARKAYGLLGSSRQSEFEDRATVAQNLGYTDTAKGMYDAADKVTDNAREDKRVNAQIENQNKQLSAQIAHWKEIERNSGGDPATKELAGLKLAEFKMQIQWQADLSKTKVGSQERDVLLQKGRDFGWIKEAPNDTTVSTKVMNDDGSETTTTSKGVAPKKKPSGPPPDGTTLRKNGKLYVVKNGVPVLEAE